MGTELLPLMRLCFLCSQDLPIGAAVARLRNGAESESSVHPYLVVWLLLYARTIEAEMTTEIQRDRTTVIVLCLEAYPYYNSSERTRWLGFRGMRKDKEMS
jgi:hypothetical protein